MELRKSIGEQFNKKHGIKLGFMSAFVKASAYALTQQPTVNAVIEGSEIIYRDYVDISVAVATPKVIFFFLFLLFSLVLIHRRSFLLRKSFKLYFSLVLFQIV